LVLEAYANVRLQPSRHYRIFSYAGSTVNQSINFRLFKD